MKTNQLEILQKETFSHIDKKRYLYRPKDPKKKGRKNPYFDPAPSKSVLLSFAFNIALENYKNMRPEKGSAFINSISDFSEMLIRFFSNKYYDKIENIKVDNDFINNKSEYQYEAIDSFRNIEHKIFKLIGRLRNYHSHYIHEPGVLTFTDLFKNEKVALDQKSIDEVKAWFHKRFDDAHRHLKTSLMSRLKKVNESLKKEKDNKERNILLSKIKEIEMVIDTFDHIRFLKDGGLTQLGQLFIASMFLTRRQAKIVLDKWRGLKDVKGYENTLHTFFSYFCIKESYSINNYHDDLLKFRKICSRLSTVAYIENDHLSFLYKKITDLNKENYQKLSETHANDKQRKEHIQKKIIPVRRKYILTEVLLQYLLDNNLFSKTNVSVAINKTFVDKVKYYKEHEEIDVKESLVGLKNRIKIEKNKDKRSVLIEHYKELKRNFVFRTPEELRVMSQPDPENKYEVKGYKFSIKRKNALLRYDFGGEQLVNATVSPEYLLKWVFLHLMGRGENLEEKLKKYVKIQHDQRKGMPVENFFIEVKKKHKYIPTHEYEHIPIHKLVPRSIREVVPKPIEEVGKCTKPKSIREKAEENLRVNLDKLYSFQKRNESQAKPWKYAAKEKIDLIFKYLHMRLLEDVYINNIENILYSKDTTVVEGYIRHTYFNTNTYDIAREYFRYFGRYENDSIEELDEYIKPLVVSKMKEEYNQIFNYIDFEIASSNRLEDLFGLVMQKMIDFYTMHQLNLDSLNEEQIKKVFKISPPSEKKNIQKNLKSMFSKSIDVSGSLIQIKEWMPKEWEAAAEQKEINSKKRANEKKYYPEHIDYSFIRSVLVKRDNPESNENNNNILFTNVDFLLQKIMLELGVKSKDSEEKKVPIKNISKVFKLLLKQKTQELVLWNVAKHYWEKASGRKYQLKKLQANSNSSNFQDYCTFNKVYQQNLQYEVVIDTSFWMYKDKYGNDKLTNNHKKFPSIYELWENDKSFTFGYKIDVPAKKYDNRFILYETDLITEYMLWHHFDHKEKKILQKTYYNPFGRKHKNKYDITQYNDVIKMVHKELIKSVVYISKILRAEKKIIDSDKGKFINLMKDKYAKVKVPLDYYLSLSNKKENNEYDFELYKVFVQKEDRVIKNNSNQSKNRSFGDYLVLFRNYSLHYQLQDPKRVEKVLNILDAINTKIELNEFFSKEEF